MGCEHGGSRASNQIWPRGMGGEEAGRLMHVAPPPKANLTGALIRPCKISRHSDQRDSLQRVPPPPPPLSSRRAKMTRNPLSAWKGLNVVAVVVSPINFNREEENISPGKVHSRASPRGDRRSKRGWLRQVSLTREPARLERLHV